MIRLAIKDAKGNVKKERAGQEYTYLEFVEEYQAGDRIEVTVEKANSYLMAQLDDALAPSLIFIKGTEWTYEVPLSEELRQAYSPKVFFGNKHYLSVRYATEDEINRYQNLALNPHDQKKVSGAYPHAEANVETRNDSTFFARNAIDGMVANEGHGSYPYQSWGINQQKDAAITIEFGRTVQVDKVALVLRSDYPHDSYWTQATLEFSDGSEEITALEKVYERQYFEFEKRSVEWVRLKNLIKAEDESPFPALTEIEIYGRNMEQ
ncbi:DUF7402 domain-containing protein [Bacillus sp. REN16]|uniref:DUF7402 domain-containing protein n=1 Tax=Bacillus sp. REN16 TaxID=2887296 RepID=UPI001E46DA90|nr:hypothetical protein [Bacillus sp. REN16]MCC3355916.1 hypothetical protein [Bacillus sp. REN16]